MRRDLSRLSPLSNLFIHHPYSQSSKASNPRLPRWRTDREADRRAGCKSVHKMFNTLSMTTRFTFTKFQKCYQHEDAKQWVISASRICDSYKNVEMHQLENGTESATCPILQMLWNKLGLGRYLTFGLNDQIFFGLFFPLFEKSTILYLQFQSLQKSWILFRWQCADPYSFFMSAVYENWDLGKAGNGNIRAVGWHYELELLQHPCDHTRE